MRISLRPRTSLRVAAALALLLGALALAPRPSFPLLHGASVLPEFERRSPEAWINTEPLTRADLRGKVVMIEIWTSV